MSGTYADVIGFGLADDEAYFLISMQQDGLDDWIVYRSHESFAGLALEVKEGFDILPPQGINTVSREFADLEEARKLYNTWLMRLLTVPSILQMDAMFNFITADANTVPEGLTMNWPEVPASNSSDNSESTEADVIEANFRSKLTLRQSQQAARATTKAVRSSPFKSKSISRLPPLKAITSFVSIKRYMGVWYMIAMKPTFYERGASDAVEEYEWNAKKEYVTVNFTFRQKGVVRRTPVRKAYIFNKGINSEWRMSPMWPIMLPYIIIELDPSEGDQPYAYTVVGYPTRDYFWIMSRTPTMDALLLSDLCTRLEKVHGYDMSRMERPSHSKVTSIPHTPSISGSSDVRSLANISEFDIVKVLGKGGFGKVYLVRFKTFGSVHALKAISKAKVISTKTHAQVREELNILKRLRHNFIVGIMMAFQTEDKICLVLDYCSAGELYFHLCERGKFPEEQARFYIAEVALALEYMHGLHIVYRDLKPENVLLDSFGNIRLTDMGCAKQYVYSPVSGAITFCGAYSWFLTYLIIMHSNGDSLACLCRHR